MSQIPREFIDLLLAKIDLVDLINTHIPLKKKSGSNYFARCPFHSEKSASFSVSQPKQFFYCFGCGAKGNAIDFLMQHDHLSFPEAIQSLASTTGLELPQSTAGKMAKPDESLPALYELAIDVAAEYYEQMKKSQRAIQYLKDRGVTGQIAQQFQIGYSPDGWSHILDMFGKTDSDRKKLLDVGLIIKKDGGGYYDRFRERIMFPIHDYRGRIIGFGGRILDKGEPKYLNSPETPLFQKGHELYGLHQALKINRKLDCALIVEGYMDVIALFQHGITYAMATLGTATSVHHLRRLSRYTSEIIFCFDGDQAGRTAAWRALQIVLPEMNDNLQIRFLFLPDGEDPDSMVRKEGKEAFEKRATKALSLSDFFFQTLAGQCDLSTMEGRARLAAMAINHIKELPAGIFQSILLEELARRARVDIKELKLQFKQPVAARPENIAGNEPGQAQTACLD
jgi:DNA primase